jgi:putative hemolysin
MNILLVLFLFNPEPAVLSNYVKNYCLNKGGEGFMVTNEQAVVISCKNENTTKFYFGVK